jgi:hypothetical protein
MRRSSVSPLEFIAIADELSRLEESAKFSAQSQLEQAKFWRATNLVIGRHEGEQPA